jgi:hypothetical protein
MFLGFLIQFKLFHLFKILSYTDSFLHYTFYYNNKLFYNYFSVYRLKIKIIFFYFSKEHSKYSFSLLCKLFLAYY